MKQEYEESQLKWSIEELCEELPQCNISLDDMLPQQVKRIIARVKDLDDSMERMKVEHKSRIAKMEVEHKARIAELETKEPGTPPVENEARAVELQACAPTIDSHLVEMKQLLNEEMHMWMTMEEIDALIEVRASLQKNQ